MAVIGAEGLSFQTVSLSSLVRGEKPALAFFEAIDILGLLCWLFKDELLAKISASLDEVADDKAALSQQQREQMEAQIMADALMIERAECSLVWHAEAQHETIDFRSDTTPMALLGVQLVNRVPTDREPARAMPSTSSSRGGDDEIVQPEAAACFLPGMREARGRFDAANGPAQHRRGSSPVPLKGTGYLGKFQ